MRKTVGDTLTLPDLPGEYEITKVSEDGAHVTVKALNQPQERLYLPWFFALGVLGVLALYAWVYVF